MSSSRMAYPFQLCFLPMAISLSSSGFDPRKGSPPSTILSPASRTTSPLGTMVSVPLRIAAISVLVGSSRSRMHFPVHASCGSSRKLRNWISLSFPCSPICLNCVYCSTNPALMIPVGIATIPTPRKVMQIEKNLPIGVIG